MSPSVSVLILLVAVPSSSLACSSARRPRWSNDLRRSCYAAVDGQAVYSTLASMQTGNAERMIGMTELASGARLVEQATLDQSGRLVEADATLTPAGAADPGPVTRVVFRPGRRSVELSTPALHLEWSVPDDLPWVWAPLLTAPSRSTSHPAPIATPLGARVAFRAAEAGRSVRLLDLGALEHHTLTADQLVITDGDSATVVLADDAVDVDHGSPRRLHLAALDTTLEVLDARAPSRALVAALRCTAPSGSIAP
jgi:hypothetical protein